MATIKRAISPEMNDIGPMNTSAITNPGLEQLPPHAHRPATVREGYPTTAPTLRSTSDRLKLKGFLIIAINL